MNDWTCDAAGRTNSSEPYLAMVSAVRQIIENHRLGMPVDRTARLVVSQLAQVHGLAPTRDAKRAQAGDE